MKKLLFSLTFMGMIFNNSTSQNVMASLKKHPNSSKWDTLFSSDLKNAIYPEGVWRFDNGVLSPGMDEVIWSNKMYQDFILDLEFKTVDGTNSGVFVYCSDISNYVPNSVEIQIADDFEEKSKSVNKTRQCAAIFGHLAPTKSMVKKPGEWNRMTISCIGKNISVILNNELVTVMDMNLWTSSTVNPDGTTIPEWLTTPLDKLDTQGYIGLQGRHASALIYFKNIRIKELQ